MKPNNIKSDVDELEKASFILYSSSGCESQSTPVASSLLGASLANGCNPGLPFLGGMIHGPDHRLSSINTLRLKAKEQMEIFKENCFNR